MLWIIIDFNSCSDPGIMTPYDWLSEVTELAQGWSERESIFSISISLYIHCWLEKSQISVFFFPFLLRWTFVKAPQIYSVYVMRYIHVCCIPSRSRNVNGWIIAMWVWVEMRMGMGFRWEWTNVLSWLIVLYVHQIPKRKWKENTFICIVNIIMKMKINFPIHLLDLE